MASLIHSRKFWLAVYGLLQAVVLQYFQVPDAILAAATALVMTLIGSIALEDAGRNVNGQG